MPTPGVKLNDVPSRVPLSSTLSKSYRGLAALANFMAQDRVDIPFAAKEISKTMSAPAECDIVAVKRLGRYLASHPRCVNVLVWQDAPAEIDAYCDADWGGDLVTRRSTSGGCLFRGRHLLTHWARTQQVVTLSSAESELHSISKCASEGLAASIMASELGMPMPLLVNTDSSAAKGIVMRSGCGKVKHLDIKTLWIQERERNGDLVMVKVPRLQNVSDLFTHHSTEAEAELHIGNMGFEVRGRSYASPARGGNGD